VVRGNDNGDATLGQALQHTREAPGSGGVESVVGLVKQEHVGTGQHGGGQGEALPHALTQAVEHVVGAFVNPNKAHDAVDEVQSPAIHHREFHERRPWCSSALPSNLFRHVTNALSPLRRVHGRSVNVQNSTVLNFQNAGERAKEGRLSGTVSSNKPNDFPAKEVEANLMDARPRSSAKSMLRVRDQMAVRHAFEPQQQVHVHASS